MKTIATLSCGVAACLLLAALGVADASPPGDKDKLTFEGKIVNVMEVYPPRLSVEAKGGHYTVQILENTKVTEGNKRIDFGKLRTNQRVRVKGVRPADAGKLQINASEVEIIQAAPSDSQGA